MSYLNKRKKKKNNIFYSWPVFLILFIFLIVLVKNIWVVYKGEKKSRVSKEHSELVLNNLEIRKDSILSEIEYLKTEKGIETEIRDKFRVVKEGEQIAVIINSEKEENNPYKDKEENLWQRFKNFLKI